MSDDDGAKTLPPQQSKAPKRPGTLQAARRTPHGRKGVLGMGKALGHPLVLLVVGAVLSGLLVPQLTQRWQDQRKALEIKAELVERVTRAVSDIFTATQFAQVGATSQSQADLDAAYRAWQRDKAVLTSLLGAYFRNPSVDDAWRRVRALATAYYVQIGVRDGQGHPDEARRREYLRVVATGLALSPPQDWSEEGRPMGSESISTRAVVLDLADALALRTEVHRQLDAAVAVIVDARLRV